MSFAAIVIDRFDTGQTVSLTRMDEAELPEGDGKIDVDRSTLNLKDDAMDRLAVRLARMANSRTSDGCRHFDAETV